MSVSPREPGPNAVYDAASLAIERPDQITMEELRERLAYVRRRRGEDPQWEQAHDALLAALAAVKRHGGAR